MFDTGLGDEQGFDSVILHRRIEDIARRHAVQDLDHEHQGDNEHQRTHQRHRATLFV
jgi:hypothetical protein